MISDKLIQSGDRSFIVRRHFPPNQFTDEQLKEIKSYLRSDVILRSQDGSFLICDEIVDAIIIDTPTISNIDVSGETYQETT